MALAMPSRFACLKIEGESDSTRAPRSQPKAPKKPAAHQEQQKTQQQQQQKKKQNSGTKKTKKKKEHTQQWEEWKQRDNDLIDESYEKDLQSAILLSKLDYEHEKDKVKDIAVIITEKKKKNKTMSLEEFNNLISGGSNKPPEQPVDENRVDFFEQVEDEIKQELSKDRNNQQHQRLKRLLQESVTINSNGASDNFLEKYTLVQIKEKLDEQLKENESLRLELDKAREEVQEVKKRNKRLCSILGHGEMKEKADVLIELERLGQVKDELTEEVTRLYQLLEQERSKVAALQQNKVSKKKQAV